MKQEFAMSKNEQKDILADFVAYCEAHPHERFWQALRNWAGWSFILASEKKQDEPDLFDTFYWNSKSK